MASKSPEPTQPAPKQPAPTPPRTSGPTDKPITVPRQVFTDFAVI